MDKVTTFPYVYHYLFIAGVIVIVWGILVIILWLIKKNTSGPKRLISAGIIDTLNTNLLVCIAISFLAFTVGFISGNSREPTAEFILSATLTIYGGFVTYSISKHDAKGILSSSLSLILFSIFIHYGTFQGSTNRAIGESNERHYNEELMKFKSKLDVAEYKEKKLFDKSLGDQK